MTKPAPLDIHGSLPLEERYEMEKRQRVSNQKIQFRLIHMPCCTILICWANPRRPNYCPECGARIFHHFPKAKWEATYSEAWLRVMNDDKSNYVCEE